MVRRIFTEYVDGSTPREIPHRLNRDGVTPPRGAKWNASTINGIRTRANGILQNELYAGVLVWNRARKIRDPDTGRRVSRPNPTTAWHRRDVPHLAIVDRKVATMGR